MNIADLVDRLIDIQNGSDGQVLVGVLDNIDVYTPQGILCEIDEIKNIDGYIEIHCKLLNT